MPEEIIPAGLKELSRFGVGKGSNALYFDNQRVHTDANLNLSRVQMALAILAAVSAFVGAIATSVSALTAIETLEIQQTKQILPPAETPEPLRIAVFPTYFDSGATRPQSQSYPSLTNAFQVLADNPQATATIHAYTDGTGSADLNRRLAQARAENVRQFLTSRSIDPARVSVKPPAADNPRADNATPDGRAQNRRVEIEIVTVPQPIAAPTS
jgi:outer membrane protein OmpA-like peptidoglycan-associated protein